MADSQQVPGKQAAPGGYTSKTSGGTPHPISKGPGVTSKNAAMDATGARG